MIKAGIGEDLEIGAAGRAGRSLELDQGRCEMVAHEAECGVAGIAGERFDNAFRAFGPGTREFQHAVMRKTGGETFHVAPVAIDRVARHELGNGGAFGVFSVGHGRGLFDYQVIDQWHDAAQRRKRHTIEGGA